MATFLLLMIVLGATYLWVRRARTARDRWISRLALPGVWQCDAPDGPSMLEFVGDPGAGRYIERSGRATERGRWELHGSSIELESEGGASCSYELRLFENGSIGIDGPGRERRIYVRQRSNVVPLRQHR